MPRHPVRFSLSLILACVCSNLPTATKAQVPPWVVGFSSRHSNPAINANYAISVTSGGYGAGFEFLLESSGLLIPSRGTAGIGHAWYLEPEFTAFDPTYAESHQPIFGGLDKFQSASVQTPENSPFYLSFYLGTKYTADPTAYYLFGWAKFTRTQDQMTLLDSAIIEGRSGIIVGTTSAVPEPSSLV